MSDPPEAVELTTVRGEIRFDDVHFGYGGEDVLTGLDLHVSAG